MAFTVTNADASTLSPARVPGSAREVHVRLSFDASYPTGGLALSPSQVGLTTITGVFSNGVTEAGRFAVPIRQSDGTYKIKAYSASTTEVSNATDLSADRLVAIVRGL